MANNALKQQLIGLYVNNGQTLHGPPSTAGASQATSGYSPGIENIPPINMQPHWIVQYNNLDVDIIARGQMIIGNLVDNNVCHAPSVPELRSNLAYTTRRGPVLPLHYEDDVVQHRAEIIDTALAPWMAVLNRGELRTFLKTRPPTHNNIVDDGLWQVRTAGNNYDTRVVLEHKSPAALDAHIGAIQQMAQGTTGNGSRFQLNVNGDETNHRAMIAKVNRPRIKYFSSTNNTCNLARNFHDWPDPETAIRSSIERV